MMTVVRSKQAPPRRRAAVSGGLLAVLLGGLAVRLVIAPFGGVAVDQRGMEDWALRLATQPLSHFYAGWADHLPGDLWILWGTVKVYQVFSPDLHLHSLQFHFMLKLVPALADVGNGGMLYLIARRLKGPGVGLLAAAFYMFNPGSIFLTSVWGQWDSVSAFFLLAASWLLMRGSPEWSLPVLTYAVLIKPLLAAVAPLFALGFVIRYLLPHMQAGSSLVVEPIRRSLRRCCIGIAASMLVLLAVILPFSVGVPPFSTHWTLLGRLRFAGSLYPFTTMNAFNLWFSPVAGDVNPDTRVFLFSLTYRQWGTILVASSCIAVLLLYWKRRDDLAFLWAILGITFSTFVFATRMHERYLFPALVFAALLAAVAPRWRWLYILVSATYLANLTWAYGLYPYVHSPLYLSTLQLFTYIASLGNVALLLYALVGGYVRPALARA